MKTHTILIFKATQTEDHEMIKTACRKHKVPYTRYATNKNLYFIDLCTIDVKAASDIFDCMPEIVPIDLNLIREGFGFKPKVFT